MRVQQLFGSAQLTATALDFFLSITLNSLSIAYEHCHARRAYWALIERIHSSFDATIGTFD